MRVIIGVAPPVLLIFLPFSVCCCCCCCWCGPACSPHLLTILCLFWLHQHCGEHLHRRRFSFNQTQPPSPANTSIKDLASNQEGFCGECEQFIGCPRGRGIGAGISGSDRMLLGPKATEAASNKINWGTHHQRLLFSPWLVIWESYTTITIHVQKGPFWLRLTSVLRMSS